MGSSILIAAVVVIAIVLVVFGAGIGVVPLVLLVAAVPLAAALRRRLRDNKQVRDFRRQSGLGDGTEPPSQLDDHPIHGPTP